MRQINICCNVKCAIHCLNSEICFKVAFSCIIKMVNKNAQGSEWYSWLCLNCTRNWWKHCGLEHEWARQERVHSSHSLLYVSLESMGSGSWKRPVIPQEEMPPRQFFFHFPTGQCFKTPRRFHEISRGDSPSSHAGAPRERKEMASAAHSLAAPWAWLQVPAWPKLSAGPNSALTWSCLPPFSG